MNLFEISRFVRQLPYYFSDYRSRHICSKLGRGHGYIAINNGVFFQCPSNPIAHSVFRDMAFCSQNRRETKEFLMLSAGCCNFVDIGASGGFFSVLFAASRTEASTILSIEPDHGACQALADLCERNQRKTVKWKIDVRGVMDETCSARFVSSGYGAELMGVRALQNARRRAAENNLVGTIFEVQCAKLEDILSEHRIQPDLIKIDIESFEFELVQSSLDILHRWRPRIMLELHVALLRARGRDPELLLTSLDSIGYRRFLKPRKELHTLLAEADASGVVRAGLLADRVP
jgi:FkbM family methyltransferase